MACDVSSLLSDACDNGFLKVAQNEALSRGILLQLYYEAAGETATYSELLQQACDNGFMAVAQNETQWRFVLLQLFCNTGGD